jgi:hypothetical protein
LAAFLTASGVPEYVLSGTCEACMLVIGVSVSPSKGASLLRLARVVRGGPAEPPRDSEEIDTGVAGSGDALWSPMRTESAAGAGCFMCAVKGLLTV